MLSLKWRKGTRKIEYWTVLFDWELSVPNVEMIKFKFQSLDFCLLAWNQIKFELDRVICAKT